VPGRSAPRVPAETFFTWHCLSPEPGTSRVEGIRLADRGSSTSRRPASGFGEKRKHSPRAALATLRGQSIARRVGQRADRQRRGAQELRNCAMRASGLNSPRLRAGADGERMGQIFFGDVGVFCRPLRARRRLAAFGRTRCRARDKELSTCELISERFRSRFVMAVGRRDTTPGRRVAGLAIDSAIGGTVSCSASRSPMPAHARVRHMGIDTCVGLQAPAHSALWSKQWPRTPSRP